VTLLLLQGSLLLLLSIYVPVVFAAVVDLAVPNVLLLLVSRLWLTSLLF
jgi:hypothetical protein